MNEQRTFSDSVPTIINASEPHMACLLLLDTSGSMYGEPIDELNKALNQVLNDKEVIKRIEDHGADVETSTPEQLGDMVKSELGKWKDVVQKARLTAD